MNGRSSTGPGPLAPMTLPRRKTTRRWYSRTTRMAWLSRTTSTTMSTIATTEPAFIAALLVLVLALSPCSPATRRRRCPTGRAARSRRCGCLVVGPLPVAVAGGGGLDLQRQPLPPEHPHRLAGLQPPVAQPRRPELAAHA